MLVQLIGAAMVFVWVVVTTGILFAVIKRTVGLRVSRQAEISGLDIFEHGQPGYVFTTRNTDPSSQKLPPSPRRVAAATAQD